MTTLSNIITPSNVLTTTNTATVTNKTLTAPTVTGMVVSDGTANGVTYLNGSKVLTSGSALTFDGTNFASTGSLTGSTLKTTRASGSQPEVVLTQTSVASWSIYNPPSSTDLRFYNGSDLLTLASAGNLGLGVTPSAWGSTWKGFQIGARASLSSSNSSDTILTNNGFNDGTNWKYLTTAAVTAYTQGSGQHAWYNAASGTAGNAISFTQAMTLDASGNLFVGTTNGGGQTGVGIFTQTAAADCLTANATNASFNAAILNIRTTRNTTNGTFKAIQYYNDGATANKFYVIDSGAIYSTSTSITSISDQRFKENIKDIDVGLNAVMALKPRRFDWIDGKGEDRKNAVGFIAQEMQTVLPDLISFYEQSPEDETEYLAIRQSDLIPTLVKAIQEQQAIIQSLKARLDAANL
jgi:hypothetical protein